MMCGIKLKRVCALSLFVAIAVMGNGQNQKIKGTWYLHEVQIPPNEEYYEDIQYDDNKCFALIYENNKEVAIEWATVDINDIEAPTEEVVESKEEPASVQDKASEYVDWSEDIGAELATNECEEMIYEIFNDTVLVLNPRAGIYNIYVIKKLTKDMLVLATDQTFQGRVIFVYGRTKQPVKYTKYNVARSDNADYPNPVVSKISTKELAANNTPAAVAYNFVNAILNSAASRMLSYMDTETASEFERSRQTSGYKNYDPFFSESGSKLNILGWKNYLTSNCEVAVLYVQSEWFDERGREIKKVYVGCVPSNEVGMKGFQDITTYGDTNVKVLVARDKDKWKVIGFK